MIKALYHIIEFESSDGKLLILDNTATEELTIVYRTAHSQYTIESFSYCEPVGLMKESEIIETVAAITRNNNYEEELKTSELMKKIRDYWEE